MDKDAQRIIDAYKMIDLHSMGQYLDDELARVRAEARAEALREDVAGAVWDIVFPYIQDGHKTEIYDEIRLRFPVPPAILADEPKEKQVP